MAASDLVQSLSRGLVILERIAASDGGMSLAHVCDAVGLKGPTAHNLLRTLAAHGFVEKIDRPTRYRLGPTAIQLGERHRQRSLMQRVEQAMRAIYNGFPQCRVSFAEALGGEVIATRRLAPEVANGIQSGSLQVMQPYVTASALLHQALWPSETRHAYARRYPFAEFGGHAWACQADLDAFLERVRSTQIAEPTLLRDPDYRLAVPVFDSGRRFVGALGAFVPDAAEPRDPVIEPLRDALIAAARDVSGAKP